MSPDLKTLFLTLLLGMAVSALLLFILHRLHRSIPGPRDWLIGKVLLAASFVLILSRGHLPLAISGALPGVMQHLGVMFLLVGQLRFCQRPVNWWWVGGGTAVFSLSFLATYMGYSSLLERLFVHDIALASLQFANGLVLLRWNERKNTSQKICSISFFVHAAFIFSHSISLWFFPPGDANLLETGSIMGLLVIETIVQTILNTGCLMLMVAEHLRHQLRDRIEDLDVARRAAEEANLEQRNFLAMVSHEFRTPLSIIDASAMVVGCNLPPEDVESAEELQRIRRVLIRLSNLVEACLADDWLASRSVSRRTEALSLRPMLEGLTAEQGVGFDWQVKTEVVLSATPYLLPIAFTCLIDNAVKYGRSREGTRVVCCDHKEIGDSTLWVQIDVHDDGPGIDADVLPHITEKYYRAPTMLHKPGAGLGLYLVKRIVDLHAGYLVISQSQNQGMTFSIRLPVSVEAGT